jgi:K(+)-stimulated pyrophosphate-energized sodium pump
MNILIKLTCLIGLVIAPILGEGSHTLANKASCCAVSEMCASMSKEECLAKGCTSKTCKYMDVAAMPAHVVSKEVSIQKTSVDGKVKATIRTSINGKVTTQNFEGTDAEVQAKIDALK